MFGLDIKRAPRQSSSSASSSSFSGTKQESEPTRAEKGLDATVPDYGKDGELVQLVLGRFSESSERRKPIEAEWALCVAMYEGRQWLGWDSAEHRAVNLINEAEQDKYVTHNLVRPLVDKLVGMATQNKPDATPAPESEAEIDRDAASEARVICAHQGRLHKRPLMMLEEANWATVCGFVCEKKVWDPRGKAEIQGPDGKRFSARIGETRSEVIPGFEMYLDPRAKRWEQCGWLIHASIQTLAFAKERYGIDADADADADGAGSGYIDAFMPGSESSKNGGISAIQQTSDKAKNRAVRVLEMWEKPTPEFENGRLIIVVGGKLAHKGPWPLEDAEDFPFVRLVYAEASGHPYGMGVMSSLAPLQVQLNRLLTKITCQIEDDKNTLLINKGSRVGADAMDDSDDTRTFRKLYWDGLEGAERPAWLPTPGVGADTYRMIDMVWAHMQHIVGIHDINMGGTPTGVSAGVSIELLQQGDRTQIGLFSQQLEQFAVTRDELDIALYAQFAAGNLPRMMSLDDTGNPGEAQKRAMAFRAITNGGKCKVIVTPGSATPKSPAGRQNEILEYFKLGLLDPANPGAEMAVRLLDFTKSDQVIDGLRRGREELAAQAKAAAEAQAAAQPDPAAVEAQRQAGAQAQQAQALDHAAQMRAIDSDARMQEVTHKADLDARGKMLDAALKARLAAVQAEQSGGVNSPNQKKDKK